MTGKKAKKMYSEQIPCCNVDEDRPRYEQAKSKMVSFIETQRRLGKRMIKVIHGYGASGVGGKNRIGLRNELARMRGAGGIREFIAGEDLHGGNPDIQQYLHDFGGLKEDAGFGKNNPGITIVLIY